MGKNLTLWIGKVVHTLDESFDILEQLGVFSKENEIYDNFPKDFTLKGYNKEKWREEFDRGSFHIAKKITAGGREFNVKVFLKEESDNGGPFWYDINVERNKWHLRNYPNATDAVVGFPVTKILSSLQPNLSYDEKEYWCDPLEFDPKHLEEMVKSVREWWAEAKVILWTLNF